MAKSLLDHAYDYVSGQSQPSKFQDIWDYCVKEAGLSQEDANAKVSRFYTNLMLDGRFVTLGENQWDLRVRHKYESVHIDNPMGCMQHARLPCPSPSPRVCSSSCPLSW